MRTKMRQTSKVKIFNNLFFFFFFFFLKNIIKTFFFFFFSNIEFLETLLEAIVSLDIRVIITDITKTFQVMVHNSTTIYELKYLIFHMRFKFHEKLSQKLAQYSICISKSMVLSDKKKLKDLEIEPKDVVKVKILFI